MKSNQKIFLFEDSTFQTLSDALLKAQIGNAFNDLIILVDENTALHCYPLLEKQLPQPLQNRIIVVPHGESAKTMAVVSDVTQKLLRFGSTRNTLLINLGGGVVSDLGGFVASVFKRGIPYINVPTSLLAMVDASVGGKTGINFHHYKNLIGTFCFPELVYVNTRFLSTLPQNHWRSGMGELFKYALISPEITIEDLRQLRSETDSELLPLITKSLAIKQKLVEIDPLDKNERHLLNVGHTIGHAFESACAESGIRMTHGEAVAAGILAECYMSSIMSGFPAHRMDQVIHLFVEQFAPFYEQLPDPMAMNPFLTHDKKNQGREIMAILFDEHEKPILNRPIPPTLVPEAINFLYQTIHGARQNT
jgi:3-dehydroquinate synthase